VAKRRTLPDNVYHQEMRQKLSSIAATWHVDPFRPNLQLKNFLNALSEHPNLTPQAVNAARMLRRGEIQKHYPVSEKLLRPASKPLYYDRLSEAFEKSSQGIRRPWWKVVLGKW